MTPQQLEVLKRIEPLLREHFHSAVLIVPCPGAGEGEESPTPGDAYAMKLIGNDSFGKGLLWDAFHLIFGGEVQGGQGSSNSES